MARQLPTARWALLALPLFPGCQPYVAVRPPAEQRTLFQPEPLGAFVRMNQTDAAQYFLSGVYGLESDAWRWAAGQAVLRFHLKNTDGLKFTMRFAVPREVTSHSGPVRLRIAINGKPWQELGYDKDGIYEIEKPAPSRLLKPEADNTVTIEVDKPVPPDGRRPELGFILVYAGFQPAS